MLNGKSKKLYIGAIELEAEAGILYDYYSILVYGIKVYISHNIEG